jgi:hypothetical protein
MAESRKLNILGIESSCDETSVAILVDDEVKANLISSQHFHKAFGGVVPELSSRAHLQMVKPLLDSALKTANLKLTDIDLIYCYFRSRTDWCFACRSNFRKRFILFFEQTIRCS